MPETPTAFFTTVTNKIGNDLPGAPTKRDPDPTFALFVAHK